MQYSSGGFPQYFPLRNGYWDMVTMNDSLHLNVLLLLGQLNDGASTLDALPRDPRVNVALEKGIQLVLDAQIQIPPINDGCPISRMKWCAQHDPVMLEPPHGRDYELESFSGDEGVWLALYLMDIPDPSEEAKAAAAGVPVWAKQLTLYDYVTVKESSNNNILVYSEGAETWPRFGWLYDSAPIFCDRNCLGDSDLEYSDRPQGFAMMDPGRRNSCGWLRSSEIAPGWPNSPL